MSKTTTIELGLQKMALVQPIGTWLILVCIKQRSPSIGQLAGPGSQMESRPIRLDSLSY